MTRGTLTVWLDGAPILDEEFSKRKLVPYQTTVWDAIAIAPGPHDLTARVTSGNDRVLLSSPFAVDLEPGAAAAVKITVKDDVLSFKRRETRGD